MRKHFTLAALMLASALTACQDKTTEAKPAPERPVLVTRVAFAPHVPERSFVGTIRPRVESDLGFRVAGKVATPPGQVGDRGQGRPGPRDPRRSRPAAPAASRPRPRSGRPARRSTQAEAELKRIADPAQRGLVDGVGPRSAAGGDGRGARPPRSAPSAPCRWPATPCPTRPSSPTPTASSRRRRSSRDRS